ncbi:MAG: dockerin type I repeat-containing protein [Planctomycetota bacterium]
MVAALSVGPLDGQSTGSLAPFVRGDCNSDSWIDASDVILLLNHIFVIGAPVPTCRDACDLNDSGAVDLIDASYLMAYMFNDGASPAPPFPAAAVDPTPGDGIGCNGDGEEAVTSGTPTLIPGAGYTGATPQPADVGTGSAATVKAIARWDVVPFQAFLGNFQIGVTAFHINGINRVEFSVEGGPWVSVSQPTLNPRTGIFEYFVQLNSGNHPAGPVRARAIAFPNIGRARVLPELQLFVTDGSAPATRYISPSGNDTTGTGSQTNPFRTVRKAAKSIEAASGIGRADGGIVYCLPGNHTVENGGTPVNTQNCWVDVRPAPGVDRSQVAITIVNDSLETKLMKFTNLMVRKSVSSGFSADEISTGAELAYFWADQCIFEGNGPDTEIGSLGLVADTRFTAYYATNTIAREERHGLRGGSLLRHVHCQNIGSDAYQNGEYLLNCTVDSIDNNQGWHADMLQWSRNSENVIVYGLYGTNIRGQGIFAKPSTLSINNVALINVFVEEIGSYKSEWEPNSNHLLIWNNSYVSHSFLCTGTSATNVSIKNCYFEKMVDYSSSWQIDNNHYRDGSGATPGTNATVGGTHATLFVNAAANDYRPKTNGPIAGSQRPTWVTAPLVPADAIGNPWGTPAPVGAMAE